MAAHGEDEFFTDGNKIYYDLETLERSLARTAEEHYDEEDELDGDEEDGAAEYNAPPERDWYHGRLDRKTAEDRLRRYGHPGSYLVRESDRQPGTYSLSFLGITGISHFRITTYAGQYYIGGRQFYSLKELIGYYASRSRLLENEVLQYPLAPQEEVARRRRVIALFSSQQPSDRLDSEVLFNAGEVFTVDGSFNDELMWCTSVCDTSKSGLVPVALVQDANDLDDYAGFEWFFSSLAKQVANDYLLDHGVPGSFLIRPSEVSRGDYSLSVHVGGNMVSRFKISRDGRNYAMGGRRYAGVEAVVSHYQRSQIVEGMHLGQPCKKTDEYMRQELAGLGVHLDRNATHLNSDAFAGFRNRPALSEVISRREEASTKNGHLVKKSENKKAWKEYFFSLKGAEKQLFFYENERQTRPKGMIDLSYSSIYPVHDSLHGRGNGFQIVVRAFNEVTTYYLCGNTVEDKQEWMILLQPLCNPSKNSRKSASGRLLEQTRSLVVNVIDAQRLPKNAARPYCIISLDDVSMARSQTVETAPPVWEEEFKLEEVHPDITSFSVAVMSRNKRIKDTFIGQVQVNISALPNRAYVDEWHDLRPRIKDKAACGSVRIRAKFQHDIILPEEEYRPLKDLLTQPDFATVQALGDVLKDRRELASTVLQICRQDTSGCVRMLRTLTQNEIQQHDDMPTLFRGNTLATSAMDTYMKSTAVSYLHATVKDIVNDIVALKQSCEINPTRMEKNEDITANLKCLLNVLNRFIDRVFASTSNVPDSLRYVLGCLQSGVIAKWPNNDVVQIRVVSGFFFLRLICPAVLNPRLFNLVTDPPSPSASRTLTLVAKCIQNLANLVEFGAKEPYMKSVNHFINDNKERMKTFVNTLATMPHCPATAESVKPHQLCRDLANMFHMCVDNMPEIRKSQEKTHSSALRKLIAATEMVMKSEEKHR